MNAEIARNTTQMTHVKSGKRILVAVYLVRKERC